MTVKELDEWYFSSGFRIMERITNLYFYEFSEEDGYQEYVDICDKYWKSLKKYEKKEYFEMYGPVTI